MSESPHPQHRLHGDPVPVASPLAVRGRRPVVIESVDSAPRTALRALLESGQRHLAVFDRKHAFLGIVSADTVAGARGPTLDGLTASPPLRLSPESSMREAASLMLTHGVDAVGVLDKDDTLVGILRWTDIVETVAGRERP